MGKVLLEAPKICSLNGNEATPKLLANFSLMKEKLLDGISTLRNARKIPDKLVIEFRPD